MCRILHLKARSSNNIFRFIEKVVLLRDKSPPRPRHQTEAEKKCGHWPLQNSSAYSITDANNIEKTI